METPFTIYKLIILYMLDHTSDVLSNSQISEFVLEKGYTNYFRLQETFSELVESGLLTRNSKANTTFYTITEEGRHILKYLEQDISREIREEIIEFLAQTGHREKDELTAPASYYINPRGQYVVQCQIMENQDSVLDLCMSMPGLEAAQAFCAGWQEKCFDIYEKIMEELL
ncbi:MAG: DUF4364 family protein [Clostridiales bacterium]|nr:DUF4364 family protein [Clostridiales bacterium]